MNQRIQQLYKQAHITQEKQVRAGGWDNDREPFEYRTVTETNFDPEKFAELIVKECTRSIENTIETDCITDGEKMGCEFAILDLLKHFGVEE